MRKRENRREAVSESQSLRVNKNAGFKATGKNSQINRRAGLHDKNIKVEGETIVKRRKPLALKHVRRMRKVGVAFAAVAVACISVVGAGFLIQTPVPEIEDGFNTVCFEAPSDGSLPTEHTLVENVGYMNYVLQRQPYWSSEMTSTVNTIIEQKVGTYKQFYENVLISAEISRGASTSATQFCVSDGVVLWRSAANDKYNGMNTEWSTAAATGMTVKDYRTQRGLPPSEFSVYVLNEKTIANAQDYSVERTADGNYKMTLNLNVSELSGETSAVHYYKQQMRVTGGLSDYPSYEFANVTYVFDKDWRVLEYEINDKYSAKLGMVSAPCSSNAHTVYNYEEQNAKNSYYKDYFEQYKSSYVADSSTGLSAASCLSNAFGNVLNEGGIFKVNLNINDYKNSGAVYVGLKDGALEDIRAEFGGLRIFYATDTDGKDRLFVSLPDGAKFKLAFDGLGLDMSGATAGLDTDALLNQLMGGDFVESEDGKTATLDSRLDLFGLKIAVKFSFVIDGEAISLGFVRADIPLGGTTVSADMTFGTEADKPAALAAGDRSQYNDLLNDGFSLKGAVSLNVGGTTVGLNIANLSLNFNGGFSMGLDAELDFGGIRLPLYASLDKDGNLKAVLDGVGVRLNIGKTAQNGGISDLQKLNSALTSAYRRAEAVLEDVFGTNLSGINKEEIKAVADGIIKLLNELNLLKSLSTGIMDLTAFSGMFDGGFSPEALMTVFGIPVKTDETTGKITVDLPSLLNALQISKRDGGLSVKLGDGVSAWLNLGAGGIDLSLDIGNAQTGISLGNLKLGAFSAPECPVSDDALLTADGVAELLDYAGAAVELISQESLAVSAKASVYESGEKACDVTVELEYYRGENGFPIHMNIDGLFGGADKTDAINFWIDPTAKLRLSVAYDSHTYNTDKDGNRVSDDDLYLDLYILDANPQTNDKGVTTGNAAKDGVLDVYLNLSKFAANTNGANPLKLYMPMDDLLTMASVGVSALNLGAVSFDGKENLNKIFGRISGVLDTLLVDKYLSDIMQQKYASLGDSLIEQILRGFGFNAGSVSDILNQLLFPPKTVANKDLTDGGELTDTENTTDGETTEPEIPERKNYVKSFTVNKSVLGFALDSDKIYGGLDFGDVGVSVTKEFVSRKVGTDETGNEITESVSRITGVSLANVYYGKDNSNKLDLSASVAYRTDNLDAFTGEGFLDYGGLDEFLNTVVNSATHRVETTQAVKASGSSERYELNSNYLVKGSLNLGLFGFDVSGINITLSVNIFDENKVEMNLRLKIPKIILVTDKAATVDLSIKDEKVYIRRLYDGESQYTYRAMTLAAFGENVMDNIQFMFTFSSLIANQLNGSGSSGTGSAITYNDYGDYLGNFISQYKYDNSKAESKKWTVVINGKSVGSLAGISLGDITIGFKSMLNGNGEHVLDGLNLNGTLYSVVSFNAALTYCNPCDEMRSYTVVEDKENVDKLYVDDSVSLADYAWNYAFEKLGDNLEMSGEIVRNLTDGTLYGFAGWFNGAERTDAPMIRLKSEIGNEKPAWIKVSASVTKDGNNYNLNSSVGWLGYFETPAMTAAYKLNLKDGSWWAKTEQQFSAEGCGAHSFTYSDSKSKNYGKWELSVVISAEIAAGENKDITLNFSGSF